MITSEHTQETIISVRMQKIITHVKEYCKRKNKRKLVVHILPYLKRLQLVDLAESQPREDEGGNLAPQFHRPCQGIKPWLPCDLGKTPQTCQVPPHSHLKERR